ncbi:hypothetical protein SAMD00023353_8500200 [Rosellinia necatrix]|uniref:C2H2-type domain-containing protein n=1 Tax=Rosellinia necatrix TaxID=77044 RepID=A0A1W2TVV1_ROSNE|nr:hypothetical protein SAMD00023353_8500200 [Rosellinia necatrix]
MEPATTTHSFLARRPAAGGLPQFHLPPPNTSLDSQVPRVSESISPPSSSLNSSTSHSPHTGITQYSNQNTWPISNTPSYTYSSVTPGPQSSVMASYGRHIYSPGAPGAPGGTGQPGYSARSSQPPTNSDGLAPPYDNVNHSYPMPISGGAGSHSSYASQPSHTQHIQHTILSSQSSQPPTPAAAAPSESYSRPPPTPGYYTAPSSTPQQPPFPAFPPPHPSPTQLSPTTTGGPSRGIPALSSHHNAPMGAPPPYGAHRHYTYPTTISSLGQNMVLSNMGNPGGQMHLMGTTNPLSAYHHGGHPLSHGIYPGAPNSQQDRPYRCDTCPQSFNRNHDLKRHKRIHLAVKPFPCEYCDKAFSRKDALKRHRLVKGCGSNGKTSPKSTGGGSPEDESKREPDGPSGSLGGIKHEPA